MGRSIRGIHEFDKPAAAIENAEGVFIGGGNTFVLLRDLYENGLLDPLRERILGGMPYMGTSGPISVSPKKTGPSLTSRMMSISPLLNISTFSRALSELWLS